ncbi:MAG: hypothetical protein ACEPOW_14695 [Bacteroidales bacterium]
MESFQKFEGIDYVNNFAVKINSMHQLVAKNLDEIIPNNSINVIDIGGGPGIGAIIIDRLGKSAKMVNVEPSNNIDKIPDLNLVEYSTLQLSFKEALIHQFPWKADMFLMISAAHEITLSNSKTTKENKEIFFQNIKDFIKTNSKLDALLSIGFPNYKFGVTEEEVLKQREFVDSLMGHSHPPEEFFTIEEFVSSFTAKPIIFDQTPMVLTGQSEKETKLMENLQFLGQVIF